MRLSRLAAFTVQQALSCLFPGLLLLTFAVSGPLTPPHCHRYDTILILALLIQWALYLARIETRDELKTIAVFHLLGFALEQFKTHLGCWSYPEDGWTKIAGVPLYSGFMYASVASYLCQAWRRLDVRLDRWPPARFAVPLVILIYVNFFTEAFWPDLRVPLAVGILLVFRRTRVTFRMGDADGSMPLSLAFVLIGFFVWVAENIATYFSAWQYPDQQTGWHAVHWAKITSWSLLVILTFIIVAQLKHVKARHGFKAPNKKVADANSRRPLWNA